MYRYFLAKDEHMPKLEENYGTWHAIRLGALGKAGKGWNAVVLHDTQVQPHPEWNPFPKVVDSKTAIKEKIDHTLLADLGLHGEETTLEATDKLAKFHGYFEHP